MFFIVRRILGYRKRFARRVELMKKGRSKMFRHFRGRLIFLTG